MKYIILFALFACTLEAQMHTWPPSGVTPSQDFSNYKLPSSRFVPSSSRYNLVWADQIVPEWVTPGKVEFAAKNYTGTQKIFAYQAEQFRAFNPNFLILIYHLAAGLNPEKNKDCPDPKSNGGDDFIGVVAPKGFVSEYKEYFLPWLNSAAIQIGSNQFESMFQHYDSMEANHRVWHNDPYWLMNMENQDWINYITQVCMEWMDGNQNEGCFFDVSVETNVSLYNPKISNPAPRNFDWWAPPHYPYGYKNQTTDRNKFAQWMNQIYAGYYRKIYKIFHTADIDYLIIPNVDQMVTTVYDPVWMDDAGAEKTIDGAMVESFGSYTGQDMYLTLERSFRHITKPGKILIAQFGANSSAERMRRTGMYMLIKNKNSFLNIINTNHVEWYPEYETDLGEQLPLPANFNDMRVAGTGWQSVWRRDYENGIVLCNTSNSAINYDLTGSGWRRIQTSGGGDVSATGEIAAQEMTFIDVSAPIIINPSDCVILLKPDKPDGVEDRESDPLHLVISPNPATYYIEINVPRWRGQGVDVAAPVTLSLSKCDDIRIYDILGMEITTPSLRDTPPYQGGEIIRIDVSHLPPGVYFVRVGDVVRKFVKM